MDRRAPEHPYCPQYLIALADIRTDAVPKRALKTVDDTRADHRFETGLPPRYYLDKTAIDWSLLTPSETVSECPYKGTTSGCLSAVVDGETTADIAWVYDFPTRALTPVAGLVAFYDNKLHVTVD